MIFLLILFLLPFQKAQAQSTPSAEILNVQYDLPYTGVLPDNPLYFLKALRDNVLGLFITDPLKKAQYDLLMADKRLSGAEALLNKKEDALAITTLSKSGNYFFQSVQEAIIAKTQGSEVNDIAGKLVAASLKHQQIIFQMMAVANKNTKGTLQASLSRIKDFQISAEALKSS